MYTNVTQTKHTAKYNSQWKSAAVLVDYVFGVNAGVASIILVSFLIQNGGSISSLERYLTPWSSRQIGKTFSSKILGFVLG